MSKLFSGFYRKDKSKEKGAADDTQDGAPTDSEAGKETNSINMDRSNSINMGRSDGRHQDLNVLISQPDIVRTISSAKSEGSSRKSVDKVDHAAESGNISLARSDGGQHCVINVFKGLSDANGAR
jgi:hypothetical protein